MKKLALLIGVFLSITAFAQDFSWEIISDGKADSTYYSREPNKNWLGCYVTIDLTIWGAEDTTATFTFGGYDNQVTYRTGKQDIKYYGNDDRGLSIYPLEADSSDIYFMPNEDSTRYGVKIAIENFAFKKPAFKYVTNSTDSLNFHVLFNAVKP